jgi:phage tail-like protein
MSTNDVYKRGSVLGDPVRNFRFIVEFYPMAVKKSGNNVGWTPVGRVGFNSVSGLAISIDTLALREGGYNTTYHQIPLQASYSPITFQRGVVLGTKQHWDWMRNMLQVIQGRSTGMKTLFRSDIVVKVLNSPVPYAMGKSGYRPDEQQFNNAKDDSWTLQLRMYNAFPSSIAYSDLNASDSALLVEQMTVVHEGFEIKWGTPPART